jgi:hypothetical protein
MEHEMPDDESSPDATSVDEFPADEDPTDIEGWHTPLYTPDGPMARGPEGEAVRLYPDGAVTTFTDDLISRTDASDQVEETRDMSGDRIEAPSTEDIYE